VFFLTGTDEHGQKIAQTAEGMGLKPIDICDKSSPFCFFSSVLLSSLELSDTKVYEPWIQASNPSKSATSPRPPLLLLVYSIQA